MTFVERIPPSFMRIALALFGGALLGIALTVIYQFASSTTDENLFTDVPSRVMIRIPVGSGDPGDILVAVGSAKVRVPSDVRKELVAGAENDSIAATLFSMRTLTLRVVKTTKKVLAAEHLFEIPPSVFVISVSEGGASDRAGMIAGDIIYRLNGQTFNSALEADLALRSGQTGRSTVYDIYRGTTPMALNVVLARFGFPIANLLMSIAGILYLCVGLFIALRRTELKAARLLGLLYLMMGLFLAVLTSRRGNEPGMFSVVTQIVWSSAVLLTFPMSVHVAAYFPRERRNVLQKKWVILSGYILAAASFGFLLLVRTNAGGIAVLIALSLFVVVGNVLLSRPKQAGLKLGAGLQVASLLAGNAPLLLLIGLSTGQMVVMGVIGALLCFVPVVMLFLIGRYRLLDLNIRVRRNVQYTLVSALWGTILVGVLIKLAAMLASANMQIPRIAVTGSSIEIIDAAPSGAGQLYGGGEKIVLMALAVVSWYGLWRVRHGGQEFIDRKYFRTRYDYRRATNELAAVVSSNLDMVELGRGIAEKLAELMHLKRSGVFFFRDETVCCCRQSWGIPAEDWEEFSKNIAGDLPGALKKFSNEFHAEYLPAGLKEVFQRHEFQYVVPIRSDAKLIGAILLGEKQSEAGYGHEDLDFLSAAAKQSSVAIENAFLYEQLAEQERMKHELQIARRIQLASLPQKTPQISGLDIAGVSLPAQEVGGDFFDYLAGREEQMTVVIGDVSGKGTSAALYMSKVQGILRSLHTFALPPDDLLIATNRLLCGDMEKSSFVTAMVAAFDTAQRTVAVARAGHLPLYYCAAATGKVRAIIPRGLGLGLNSEGIFSEEIEERAIPYEPGDVFLFLTDGITEAKDASGQEYGEEKVIRALERHAASSAAFVADALMRDVAQFASGVPQHDDQTVVVVRIS